MAQKRKWEDVISQIIRAGKKFKRIREGNQKNSIIFLWSRIFPQQVPSQHKIFTPNLTNFVAK
jgi:hypothetical protein